jgi:hypothetical protein
MTRWAILVLLPVGLVWLGTCWIRSRSAKNYSRVLITPMCLLAFAGVNSWDEGKWQCRVCGAMEHRLTYFGWVLEKGPPTNVPEEEDSSPFERWFRSEIRVPHSHDWVPVGCHRRSSALKSEVACSEYPRHIYYRALPSLPDPKVAASMIGRVLHATHEQRRELLLQVNGGLRPNPFTEIADGHPMTTEEFDRAYSDWLVEHPDWR